MKNKAFTLIELLVVIAVIALLSSIIYSSVSQARAKAENASAKAESKEIEKATQMLKLSGSLETAPYPSTGANTPACVSQACIIRGQAYESDPDLATAFSEYFPELPDTLNAVTIDGYDYAGVFYQVDEESGDGYLYYTRRGSDECSDDYVVLTSGDDSVCGFVIGDDGGTPIDLEGSDSGPVTITIENTVVPVEGSTYGVVRLTLSSPNTSGSTQEFRLAVAGNATPGTDYPAYGGSGNIGMFSGNYYMFISIANGQTYGEGIIEAWDDFVTEGTEFVGISNLEQLSGTEYEIDGSSYLEIPILE